MDLNKHYFCNFSFSFVSKFHGGVSKITKMYSFEPRRLVSDQNRAHLCEHEAGRGAAGAPRPPRAPRGFRARIGVARSWAHGREAVTLLAPRTQSRRRPRAVPCGGRLFLLLAARVCHGRSSSCRWT